MENESTARVCAEVQYRHFQTALLVMPADERVLFENAFYKVNTWARFGCAEHTLPRMMDDLRAVALALLCAVSIMKQGHDDIGPPEEIVTALHAAVFKSDPPDIDKVRRTWPHLQVDPY